MWANAPEPTYGACGLIGPVEQLGDVVADARQLGQAALGQAAVTELELEVADDRREVGVAGALADARQRPLHVARPAGDGSHRVGDGATGVVVAVDADGDVVADVGDDGGRCRLDLVGQRTAVRVAQHDVAGAADDGGLERPQRELRVGLVAVEEVLHVDEDEAAGVAEEAHRVGDHRLAFVERRLQRLGDVIGGALGDDAHRRCRRVEEVAQRVVGVDLAPRPPGRPEGDERRRREVELRGGPGEELDVLGVGAGPAALDEVDPEHVELLGDAQLVLDGGGDPLDLQAVAERRVEDLDRRRCGGHRVLACARLVVGWNVEN